MRLIFVRHGETEENTDKIIQGQLIHGKLSENGLKQIKKLADRLKDEKIDYIYSSDSERSEETAKEIAKYHPHIKVELVKDLRERHYGKFEGKKYTEIPDWDIIRYTPDYDMEGGESMKDVFKRMELFLDKIFQRHKNDTVLWVGHGMSGKHLTALVSGKVVEKVKELPHIHNTSISIFEINEDKKHKIHVLNDVTHLT